MLNFFIVFTLVLCCMHIYLFFKLRPIFRSAPGQALLLLLFVTMLVLLCLRSSHMLEDFLPTLFPWVIYTWLGFITIAFYCFIITDTIRLLALLLKLASGKNILYFATPRGLSLFTLITVLLIMGYAMFEARNVAIKYVSLQTDKPLGNIEKLRIVAISDLHIGDTISASDLAKWTAMVEGQNPDILVVAGDILDADMSQRDKEAHLLRSIKTKYGAYAVLGNHEVYSGLHNSRNFIRRAGLTLLENRAVTSGPINIVGIDDPQAARFGNGEEPNVPGILQGVDRESFTLLLKHRPIFQDGEIGLFDLQVSGHTHGGQIWPGRLIVRKIFGFPQGLSKLDDKEYGSMLYLMNGTGYWGSPMRLFARPEILVFDITSVDIKPDSI